MTWSSFYEYFDFVLFLLIHLSGSVFILCEEGIILDGYDIAGLK